jgi:nucleotide-binding universal stress UspA family protein
MTTRILVPLDGSPLSEQALPAVRKFVADMTSCSIELLYVIDPSMLAIPTDGGILPPSYLERAADWATEYLAEEAKSLRSLGVAVQEVVSAGPPARVILDQIKAGGFDYVFMATHGRSGFARAVIGSVTDRVIREAAIPVIAIHPLPVAAAEEPWPGEDASPTDLIKLFARGDLLSTRAMEALTKRGAPAIPDLVDALSSDSVEVRQFAARTLGAIGTGKAALHALVQRLSDEVWEVRWEAEEALAHFGEAGVEAVLEALMHAPPDARFDLAVLHVLDRAPMEHWDTLKPVVHALRTRDSSLSAPIAAAKALRKLQHKPERATVV